MAGSRPPQDPPEIAAGGARTRSAVGASRIPSAGEFHLSARVSSDRPEGIRTALEDVVGPGAVARDGAEFVVEADLPGTEAKELNRSLLSALRRAEKRTRLRARWTAPDGTEYRFFDYVLKKTTRR